VLLFDGEILDEMNTGALIGILGESDGAMVPWMFPVAYTGWHGSIKRGGEMSTNTDRSIRKELMR
jgi:hypothetical protein